MGATDEGLEARKKLVEKGAERLGECPNRLDKLEELVGLPADEQTKPLFEIIGALNKEVAELRLKVENMKKSYDYKIEHLTQQIERIQGWVR